MATTIAKTPSAAGAPPAIMVRNSSGCSYRRSNAGFFLYVRNAIKNKGDFLALAARSLLSVELRLVALAAHDVSNSLQAETMSMAGGIPPGPGKSAILSEETESGNRLRPFNELIGGRAAGGRRKFVDKTSWTGTQAGATEPPHVAALRALWPGGKRG